MLSHKNDVSDVNNVMHYQVDVNAPRIKKHKKLFDSMANASEMMVSQSVFWESFP